MLCPVRQPSSRAGWKMSTLSRLGAMVAPPRTRGGHVRLRWAGAALALASLVLFLESRTRAMFRCRQQCYGAPPVQGYGSSTYEPGHPWTSYAHSWQWSAQHGLTQFALIV